MFIGKQPVLSCKPKKIADFRRMVVDQKGFLLTLCGIPILYYTTLVLPFLCSEPFYFFFEFLIHSIEINSHRQNGRTYTGIPI